MAKLAEKEVKATFFLNGDFSKRHHTDGAHLYMTVFCCALNQVSKDEDIKGNCIYKYAETIQMACKAGHDIGSHTWSAEQAASPQGSPS